MSCFSGKKEKKEEATPVAPDQQPWAIAHLDFAKQPTTTNQDSKAEPSQPKKVDFAMPHKKDNRAFINATAVAATEDVDAITPLPRRDVYTDPLTGHSNVTIPARPRHKHAFSECFDLDDIEPGGHVRSPSGNMLSAEQAALRLDRPLGIKERQQAIRQKVAEQNQVAMGNQVTVTGDVNGKKKQERDREAEVRRRVKQIMDYEDDENERELQGPEIGCGWCQCRCQ